MIKLTEVILLMIEVDCENNHDYCPAAPTMFVWDWSASMSGLVCINVRVGLHQCRDWPASMSGLVCFNVRVDLF